MESIIPNSNGCIFSIPKSNGLHWSSGCAGKKLKKGIDFQTPMDYIPQSPKPHTYYEFQKPKDTKTRKLHQEAAIYPGPGAVQRAAWRTVQHQIPNSRSCTSVQRPAYSKFQELHQDRSQHVPGPGTQQHGILWENGIDSVLANCGI